MAVATDRTKYEGNSTEGASVVISRNTDDLYSHAGAFIYSRGPKHEPVIPVDQLDAVIEALKTIKDEYEALKPKVVSLQAVLEVAPVGTTWERISFPNGVRVRVPNGYIITSDPKPSVFPLAWLTEHADDYTITYPKGHNA